MTPERFEEIKYAQHYRHSRPEMLELDIFRTTVYYDSLRKATENPYVNLPVNGENLPANSENLPVNLDEVDKEIIIQFHNDAKTTYTYAFHTILDLVRV